MGETEGGEEDMFNSDLETRCKESCGLEQGGRALAAWSAGRAASLSRAIPREQWRGRGLQEINGTWLLKGKKKKLELAQRGSDPPKTKYAWRCTSPVPALALST